MSNYGENNMVYSDFNVAENDEETINCAHMESPPE